MPIDLTNIKAKVNTLKRDLFYDKSLTMVFKNEATTLLTLSSGWYMKRKPDTDVSDGAQYFTAYVADVADAANFETTLALASAVYVGTEKFHLRQFYRPRSLTKVWKLRLECVRETA